MIEQIVLTVDGQVISIDNQIPLILEAHLERLRSLIKGKIVLLGRKCYESLGEKNALASTASRIVVLSRNMNKKQGISVIHSLSELVDNYKDFIVLGGESTFMNLIMMTDIVYVTEVSETPEPGTYKTFKGLKRFHLENPNAEFLNENDHYFRLLEYKR